MIKEYVTEQSYLKIIKNQNVEIMKERSIKSKRGFAETKKVHDIMGSITGTSHLNIPVFTEETIYIEFVENISSRFFTGLGSSFSVTMYSFTLQTHLYDHYSSHKTPSLGTTC